MVKPIIHWWTLCHTVIPVIPPSPPPCLWCKLDESDEWITFWRVRDTSVRDASLSERWGRTSGRDPARTDSAQVKGGRDARRSCLLREDMQLPKKYPCERFDKRKISPWQVTEFFFFLNERFLRTSTDPALSWGGLGKGSKVRENWKFWTFYIRYRIPN